MPFTYNAGTTGPTLAGLVQFNGVRINDGTYKSQHLGGLIDGPTLRIPVTPYPNADGAFIGSVFKDPLTINIDGWMLLDTIDYLGPAIDYLNAAFTPSVGVQTLTFQVHGWAATKTIQAMVTGPIVFNEPDIDHKKLPWREFTIPMLAPDPTVT